MGGRFLYFDRTTCTSRIDWMKMICNTLTRTNIKSNVIYPLCITIPSNISVILYILRGGWRNIDVQFEILSSALEAAFLWL